MSWQLPQLCGTHVGYMQVADFLVPDIPDCVAYQSGWFTCCVILQIAGDGAAGSATVELAANEFVQAVQLESDRGKALLYLVINQSCQHLWSSTPEILAI